jgi:hypothetical protein
MTNCRQARLGVVTANTRCFCDSCQIKLLYLALKYLQRRIGHNSDATAIPDLTKKMAVAADSLLESISEALSAAQVPCILWGHVMLSVHGVPTIIGVVILIVATRNDANQFSVNRLRNRR